MRERLRHIATAVSLLLFVLLVSAAVLSWFRGEHLQRTTWTWDYSEFGGDHIYIRDGSIGWAAWRHQKQSPLTNRVTRSLIVKNSDDQQWKLTSERLRYHFWHNWLWDATFHRQRKSNSVANELMWDVSVSLWPSIALSAFLPWRWLVAYRARRRAIALNLCRHCGYDLRATKGRCPECGRIVNGI